MTAENKNDVNNNHGLNNNAEVNTYSIDHIIEACLVRGST